MTIRIKTIIICLLALTTRTFADSNINIGVFLPFNDAGKQKTAVEYYRGLLMAVDSLNSTMGADKGTTFHITAADCGSTATDMLSLLDETKNGVFDIIFAPSNQNQLQILDNYSRLNGAKVCVPFGGRYDEWVSNPAFIVLWPTQTDLTASAAKLIQEALPSRHIIIIETSEGSNQKLSPLANYCLKYIRGTKTLALHSKEKKILKSLSDKQAILIPASFSAESVKSLRTIMDKTTDIQAAVILQAPNLMTATIPATTLEDRHSLRNTYVIQQYYPRYELPRVKKFADQYRRNFDTLIPRDGFSPTLWGFDTGYYLLKSIINNGRKPTTLPVYAAPLQSAFSFTPRSGGQGLVNTAVMLIHYKSDGSIDIIEPKAD